MERAVDIVYLDFSKAFHMVPHSLLPDKLLLWSRQVDVGGELADGSHPEGGG